MDNSMFFTKNLKWLIFKFSTMITSYFLNFHFLFRLYLRAEVTEYIISIILASQEFNPSPSAVIINND